MNNQLKILFSLLGIIFFSAAAVHASEDNISKNEPHQQGTNTTSVKGIVTGNADEYYYLRTEEGRQVIIQTNSDTKIDETIKKGDWIEATILPNDNATSVKKIKRPETN